MARSASIEEPPSNAHDSWQQTRVSCLRRGESIDWFLSKAWSACRITAGVALLPLFALTVAESAIVGVAVVVVSVAFFPVWYFGRQLESRIKQRRGTGS